MHSQGTREVAVSKSYTSRMWALKHTHLSPAHGAPRWTPTTVTGHGDAQNEGGPLLLSHSLSWHTVEHKNSAKPYLRTGRVQLVAQGLLSNAQVETFYPAIGRPSNDY